MKRTLLTCGVFAGTLSLVAIHASRGSVGLIFTDNDATPTAANVGSGGTFLLSAKLTESLPTDQVSGVDYQIQSSNNGVFEFLSRNSQVAGSNFTVPNGLSDAALMPIVLNPINGTDLGTSTNSGLAVSGAGIYELADFSFEVLPGTPAGTYTLSFVSTGTSGPPPGYAVGSFDTLGTFAVTVPEPVSMCLLGVPGMGLLLRRQKR